MIISFELIEFKQILTSVQNHRLITLDKIQNYN